MDGKNTRDNEMKIIFLDIDGVVTSARDNGYRDFNLHVVHWLRWVCSKTGAKIVISSTWRHSHDKDFWQTIFAEHLHDDWRTPDGCRRSEGGVWISPIRGDEIAEWLDGHEGIDYVILDDDSDFRPDQKGHLIRTDGYNGMLFASFMALRDKFGIDDFPKWDAEIYQHPNMFGVTRVEDSMSTNGKSSKITPCLLDNGTASLK